MSDLNSKALVSGSAFQGDSIGVSYFMDAERSIERQWFYYIWPRISKINRQFVVEIAAGYGRNTERLASCSVHVLATDINAECIDYINRRLSGSVNISTLKVNGADLLGVPDECATLVYSFDSMVHFEPEVVESYVSDIKRVLTKGGVAFIHHSNYILGKGCDFRTQPHWRNYMSKELFGKFVASSGLTILSQNVFDWDESYMDPSAQANLLRGSDCISLFVK